MYQEMIGETSLSRGRPLFGAGLSRRALLAGCAFGVAGGLVGSVRAARALGRLAVGDGDLAIVSDGYIQLPVAGAFPDAPSEAVEALLAAGGMPTDAFRNDCNVTVLRTGGRVIVFDAGAGPSFLPTTGRLAENLAEAGVDPAEVTDVVFTHAHPDHLWGLVDDFDEPVFPEATYRIAAAEWDFWSAEETMDLMPEERKSFVAGARNRFAAMEDRVTFFADGEEVLPGVEAVATPGHTPGHTSFLVHGTDPVLVVGDALMNAVVSLARPDWRQAMDFDPDLAAATRARLLDRVVADRARVVGFHFPHPGAGAIERDGTAYRFAPA